MVKYIIPIYLFFVSFQLNSQFLTHRYEFEKVKNEREEIKKQRIHIITEYVSDKLNINKLFLKLNKTIEFDSDGYKLVETYYSDGNPNLINKYYYNIDSNLFKTVSSSNEEGNLVSYYHYDRSNRLIEEFYGGGENRKYNIKYDNKGRIIEKIGFTGSLPLDDEGNIIENADPIWDFVDRYEYEYNSNGDLAVEYFYYLDQSTNTNFYYYDKSGKKTKWINRLGEDYDVIYDYNYDKNGKLTYIKVTSPEEVSYLIYDYEYYIYAID
ncbi:MAG: hypothetical protein N2319_09055 [Candidatus Kapabacteria bacterium]|nr:hypothetical protein [Candidatus Kapabacteria bacterium]